jgi:hypothetical protein
MLFRRASVRYGRTPEPETPYQKAAQVWDERIGSARVQARNWRLIAFGNLFRLCCAVSAKPREIIAQTPVDFHPIGYRSSSPICPATQSVSATPFLETLRRDREGVRDDPG